MSLNGSQEEELNFNEREIKRANLSMHPSLQTRQIKNKSQGLDSFLFYRKLRVLQIKEQPKQKQTPSFLTIAKKDFRHVI